MTSEDECWLWGGARKSNGYATFSIRKHEVSGRESPNFYAHRVSHEIWLGPIPDGLLVCHSCDNRRCVNPWHLFLGTAKDNTADMMKKDRYRHGSKLSDLDVLGVAEMCSRGVPVSRVANEYNISCSTVYRIINKKTRARETRALSGDRLSPYRTLGKSNALEIRALRQEGVPRSEVAKKFNVSEVTVWRVEKGRTWKGA